ncbi:hypothetical protein RvY_06372 [Ramazzottius varieornatus]|uniref:Uncharacterized protein n=1 Tax=Ramazzottius varieornatus TaxID=947166 RepID=A0A1D1V802_RAMVA|nr:hypothetical protein RvY_06372 [Ramazzottius varieornatus]
MAFWVPYCGQSDSARSTASSKIAEWSQEYGPTVGLWMGSRPMVVIHDPELARTVFNDDNITGRDRNLVFNHIFKGRGLLQSEGELWREHRRFTMGAVQELGMGKGWMEEAILLEVREVVGTFKAHVGQRYDHKPLLTSCVASVVAAMVFGQRFDPNDQRFLTLSNLFAENQKLVNALLPIQAFPFLKYIPGLRFRPLLQQLQGEANAIIAFCRGFMEERKQELQKRRLAAAAAGSGQPSVDGKDDYIMAYLKEREKAASYEQLLYCIYNLFAAGSQSTAATLMWAMICYGQFPQVQQKIHAEIDAKIGRNRPITMAGRSVLPYSKAALNDIQRLASVGPLGVARTNYQAMTVDGYAIPPRKRLCLSEPLARMELFLFFANIMQNFEVRGHPAELKDAQEKAVGLTFAPGPFKAEMTYRDSD